MSVNEVLKKTTENTVKLLRAELEIKRKELQEKLFTPRWNRYL